MSLAIVLHLSVLWLQVASDTLKKKQIKPEAERSKSRVNMKEKCLPLGVLSFLSDLVFWLCQLSAIPQVFMHTGVV